MVVDDKGVLLVELEAFALPIFQVGCLPFEVLEAEAATPHNALQLEGDIWDATWSGDSTIGELAASFLSSLTFLTLKEAIA